MTHPLVAEGPAEHRVKELVTGLCRVYQRPNRPPLTYIFDPLTPARLPVADVWVGFNCLVTAQGLLRRRVGRARRVIHWSVDYVPQRFGRTPLTTVYERLDRWCITSSDARVELSDAAMRGRLSAYGLMPDEAPAEIVPMGAWIHEAPTTSPAALEAPRLVFLGHLVERMGVPLVVDTIAELRRRGMIVHADVVGGGPLLETLRTRAADRGVDDAITFHGFVTDFHDVERVLAAATIALAPYETSPTSFSRFADPGKLKAYLAAGLPILLTPVPPNADELVTDGGAWIVQPNAERFADAIADLLVNHAEWNRRHEAACLYAKRFDWDVMLSTALPRLGIELNAGGQDPTVSPRPASAVQTRPRED
ncbi:MAG: glycosyltransferase [Ilumatobacteraceae bacterium]